MEKVWDFVAIGYGMGAHQLTPEAIRYIDPNFADKLYYLSADSFTTKKIIDINPSAINLFSCYDEEKDRLNTYNEFTATILNDIRKGLVTVFLLPGHPLFGVNSTIDIIRQATKENYRVTAIPGISSFDCLFADANFDPATGTFISEIVKFVGSMRNGYKPFHDHHHVIIQPGVGGDPKYKNEKYDYEMLLEEMISFLIPIFGEEHEVLIYLSSITVKEIDTPSITWTSLKKLMSQRLTGHQTIYIPPISVK